MSYASKIIEVVLFTSGSLALCMEETEETETIFIVIISGFQM